MAPAGQFSSAAPLALGAAYASCRCCAQLRLPWCCVIEETGAKHPPARKTRRKTVRARKRSFRFCHSRFLAFPSCAPHVSSHVCVCVSACLAVVVRPHMPGGENRQGKAVVGVMPTAKRAPVQLGRRHAWKRACTWNLKRQCSIAPGGHGPGGGEQFLFAHSLSHTITSVPCCSVTVFCLVSTRTLWQVNGHQHCTTSLRNLRTSVITTTKPKTKNALG